MLAIVGDVHGAFDIFGNIVQNVAIGSPATAIIQVGDFGYYASTIPQLRQQKFALPVYWIDGNHEDHEYLEKLPQDVITEVHYNCFYVPRGLILTLDNRRIAFMGGAASPDYLIRKVNRWHWDTRENITPEQKQRLWAAENIDVFVSHAPPQSVIDKHCDPRDLVQNFGLPITWKDPNCQIIDDLWTRMNKPPLFCGHLHREITEGNVRILDVNEIYYLE